MKLIEKNLLQRTKEMDYELEKAAAAPQVTTE
jgi:hypothetical protein